MLIAIRKAVPDDCSALLGLIAAHATFERSEATITQDVLDTILRSPCPEVQIMVAEKQAMLVGYAALTLDFSLWRGRRWAHLDCLFVHEAYRGCSTGRRLLTAAKCTAQALDADRMEWQTPIWNKPAIRFYAAQNAQRSIKSRFCTAL